MAHAHIDAAHGVTGEMLLGALVDAGASIEGVEDAVALLGVGTVKLAWARVPRGKIDACAVRVRAPEDTPELPTWRRIREVVTFMATPDACRDRALETVRRLVTAEAEVAGADPEELDLPQVGVLDMLANVVGVCAALHELGVDRVTVGPVGVGSGTIETFAGEQEVPGPAVRALLDGFDVRPLPVAAELTSATGAALLATMATPAEEPDPARIIRTGIGAGHRSAPSDTVLRVLLWS